MLLCLLFLYLDIALIENNARIAADISVELSKRLVHKKYAENKQRLIKSESEQLNKQLDSIESTTPMNVPVRSWFCFFFLIIFYLYILY